MDYTIQSHFTSHLVREIQKKSRCMKNHQITTEVGCNPCYNCTKPTFPSYKWDYNPPKCCQRNCNAQIASANTKKRAQTKTERLYCGGSVFSCPSVVAVSMASAFCSSVCPEPEEPVILPACDWLEVVALFWLASCEPESEEPVMPVLASWDWLEIVAPIDHPSELPILMELEVAVPLLVEAINSRRSLMNWGEPPSNCM